MHEHLEHAEHAEHHAADPFDKRVAVSMAIVAAVLAGVSLVGHRAHNKILQLQGEANQVHTQAAAAEVDKSNLFAWYQSKKLRQAAYEVAADQTELSEGKGAGAAAKIADWRKKAEKYNAPDPKRHESLPELIERGTEAGKKADKLNHDAAALHVEAEHVHHQADRLDLAHLLSEFGLVLCSITILTKQRAWWLAGILSVVLALAATGSAYMIPHDDHAAPHADGDHGAKPEKKPADAH